ERVRIDQRRVDPLGRGRDVPGSTIGSRHRRTVAPVDDIGPDRGGCARTGGRSEARRAVRIHAVEPTTPLRSKRTRMPLKSTVFARWKWLTGAVAAMVALLAIAAGVSAAGVSGTKAVSRPPTAASGFDDRPRAEIAAEALLLEVEPVGDFGFVLYDSAR